jgi:hypothetical protein
VEKFAMGFVAETYKRSGFALNIKTWPQWFENPILGPEDQPHVPPPYKSLVERVNAQVGQDKAKALDRWQADFVNRSQAGAFPFWGPPGPHETRPHLDQPEQTRGALLNGLV